MKKSLGPILIVAALTALTLGVVAWFAGRRTVDVMTDGAGLDLASNIARPRDVLWRTPEPLDEHPVPAGAVGGAFSADGGRFVLAATGPGGDLDLFESILTPRGWSEPQRIDALSSPDHDTTPAFGPDGRLWFASDRAGGAGGYDLWVAAEQDGAWTGPAPASSIVPGLEGSAADELHPALSPDGGLLCFAQRDNADAPFDIVALDPRTGAARDELIALLNTPANDRSPSFSPAGDFLYFASDRDGGAGGLDLYRVRLTGEGPGEVWWLGEEVNSPGDEADPSLTMAGFRLRFRAETADGGAYLQTTAREVYRTVRSTWSLAISAQILRLLPWILLALALVLLLAGLRRFARSGNWQRRLGTLGLMARCILASCVIHAVLALLLNVWSIHTSIPGAGEDSATRVALTTSRSVDAAAAQLLAPAVADAPAPADDAQPDVAMEAAPPTEQRIDAARTAPALLPSTVADAAHTDAAAPSTPAPAMAQAVEAASVPSAQRIQASESSAASLAPADQSRAAPAPETAAARSMALAAPTSPAPPARHAVRESSLAAAARSDAPPPHAPPTAEIPAGAMPSQAPSRVEEPSSASLAPAQRESRAEITPDAPAPFASPAAPSSPARTLPTFEGSMRDSQVPAARSSPLLAAAPPAIPPAADILASPLPTGARDSREARPDERPLALLDDLAPATPAPLAAPAPVLRPSLEPRAAPSEPPARRDAIRDVRLPTPTTTTAAAEADAPTIRAPMLPAGRLIAGVVLDAQTGAPIPNARIRLDGDGDLIRSAVTGDDGQFALTPAELPEFAALTAAADGYQSGAENVAERDVGDGAWIEFRLEPVSRYVLAFEDDPAVHHLGNDRFSGRINSQFQVPSEGTLYRAVVTLDRDRLPPAIDRAALAIMVRGAQNPNQIAVNGVVLDARLDESPANGSFGEFIAEIPVGLLVPGRNVLEIRAVARPNTDIDDFEFVNPTLYLKPAGAGRTREAL